MSEVTIMHRCSVCSKMFVWNDESRYRYILVGHGYNGYEVTFKACSKFCIDKTEGMNKKQLLQLHNKHKIK